MIVVFSLSTGVFRAPGGSFATPVCLAVATGISLFIIGITAGASLRAAGLWTAMALTGQAASLQLIGAGRQVGYQHYLPVDSLLHGTALAAVVIIAAQASVAAAGLIALRGRLIPALTGRFTTARLVILAVVFVLTSTALSRDPGFYVYDLAISAAVQTIALVTIALAVLSIPEASMEGFSAAASRVLGPAAPDAAPDHGGIDGFSVVVAALATVAAAMLAYFVYDAHPHLSDEVSYLYQAKYFAEGRLSMALPPVPEAFDVDLMHYAADRWYSPVPPGWPMLLSVGVMAGAPWLVNPVMAGVSVVLACVLFRGLFDRQTSRVATMMLAVSPWFLFMAMNMLTHTFALAAALASAVCVMRSRRASRALGSAVAWGLAGGLATGVLAAIRPLEGLITALLLGLWALVSLPEGRKMLRITVIPAAAYTVGTIIAGSMSLVYNRAITGSARNFPIMEYTDKYYGKGSNALGFGPDKGLGWALDPFPGHGLADAVVNANLNLSAINTDLFGWAAGSVLIIAAFVLSRGMRRADWLMAAFIAGVAGIHTFYWFSGGPDFGARYWYLVIVPAAALAARGVMRIPAAPSPARQTAEPSVKNNRLLAMACILAVMAFANFMPWRAADKYTDYLGMSAGIRTLAEARGFDGGLVLISGERFPDYASAAVLNPVDLDSPRTIYAWDKDPGVRKKVIAAYPERPVWLVDGPTITGAWYRVKAGPLQARELMGRGAEDEGALTFTGNSTATETHS